MWGALGTGPLGPCLKMALTRNKAWFIQRQEPIKSGLFQYFLFYLSVLLVMFSAIFRPRPSRPGPRAPHIRGPPTFQCLSIVEQFSKSIIVSIFNCQVICIRCVAYLSDITIQFYGQRLSTERNVWVELNE